MPTHEDSARLLAEAEAQLRERDRVIEKRDRELAILSDVAARIHGEDDVQRILDIALDAILGPMGLRTAWVFMGDDRDRKLRLVAHRGVSAAYLDDLRSQGLGDCLCPEVFASGHRMLARNTLQCPRMPEIVQGLNEPVAHACIPLKLEGGSRGVLNVAARPGEAFTDEELRFLETLGHQVCLAVERARHLELERARNHEARTLYDDLKAAQARIIQAEKMAAMGTFAAGLAHEVRNPLNSIGLQLSLLERRACKPAGRGAKDIGEAVGIIRDEIRRLDTLVNDFLLLSRTNRMSFRRAGMDALIDEVLRLLEPEARAAGVKVERRPCGDPIPDVAMDPEKMKQVILNLVRNAIEAMAQGGSVVVETAPLQGRVCVRVRDTGPGLPEAVDVFQVFTSTKPGGTGLGLPIAQQIVLDHGGEISADSAPGQGATFTILLPATPPDAAVLEK